MDEKNVLIRFYLTFAGLHELFDFVVVSIVSTAKQLNTANAMHTIYKLLNHRRKSISEDVLNE